MYTASCPCRCSCRQSGRIPFWELEERRRCSGCGQVGDPPRTCLSSPLSPVLSQVAIDTVTRRRGLKRISRDGTPCQSRSTSRLCILHVPAEHSAQLRPTSLWIRVNVTVCDTPGWIMQRPHKNHMRVMGNNIICTPDALACRTHQTGFVVVVRVLDTTAQRNQASLRFASM